MFSYITFTPRLSPSPQPPTTIYQPTCTQSLFCAQLCAGGKGQSNAHEGQECSLSGLRTDQERRGTTFVAQGSEAPGTEAHSVQETPLTPAGACTGAQGLLKRMLHQGKMNLTPCKTHRGQEAGSSLPATVWPHQAWTTGAGPHPVGSGPGYPPRPPQSTLCHLDPSDKEPSQLIYRVGDELG